LVEVTGAKKNNVLTEKKIKDFVSTEVVAHIAGTWACARHDIRWPGSGPRSLSFSSRLPQSNMSITWRPTAAPAPAPTTAPTPAPAASPTAVPNANATAPPGPSDRVQLVGLRASWHLVLYGFARQRHTAHCKQQVGGPPLVLCLLAFGPAGAAIASIRQAPGICTLQTPSWRSPVGALLLALVPPAASSTP
jgi:hypothetical protein